MVAGFPDAPALALALRNPGNPNFKAQASGIRLTPSKSGSRDNSSFKLVYWEDGSLMTLMTAIVTHDQRQVTLGGGVLTKKPDKCLNPVTYYLNQGDFVLRSRCVGSIYRLPSAIWSFENG